MFTAAQDLYLQEVLGVAPASFAVPLKMATPMGTVIVTGPLSTEESALLEKILSSVQLGDFTLQASVDSGSGSARHLLIFGGDVPPGRHENDKSIRWGVPSLKSMIGSGPDVAENKKFTWNLLRQMARQLA